MYIKKTWDLGNSVEIEKCYTSRYGKKGKRHSVKCNPTPEAMKNCNRMKAIDKIRRLIKYNFPDGFHLTLTYKPNNRPDVEQAHKNLNNQQYARHYRIGIRTMEFWRTKLHYAI